MCDVEQIDVECKMEELVRQRRENCCFGRWNLVMIEINRYQGKSVIKVWYP